MVKLEQLVIMGIRKSRQAQGADTDRGLLSLENLIPNDFNIENLTFQDGRSKVYAYVGALKVNILFVYSFIVIQFLLHVSILPTGRCFQSTPEFYI